MATRIAGMALNPRVSRNGVFYFPQELEKFDKMEVPLKFNHTERIIGKARFILDRDKNQLNYEATITDPEFQKRIEVIKYQVSIGAMVEKGTEDNEICHPEGKGCFKAPVIAEPSELSIVEIPGIPESSVNVIERDVVQEVLITSNSSGTQNKINMAEPTKENKVEEKTKITIETDDKLAVVTPTADVKDEKEESKKETKEDCGCQHNHSEAPETTEPKHCPEGQKFDIAQNKCVAVESNTSTIEKSKNEVSEVLKANEKLISEIRENWTPKSQVSEGANDVYVEEVYNDEDAGKILQEFKKHGYVNIEIDKEGWINAHSQGKENQHGQVVTEVVSTSGTIPGVKLRSDIHLIPGAKSYIPVRQYGMFEAIPTGQNTARFYKMTIPDAGAITESATTDITAATHTLTSIDVTCSIRGWRQVVLKQNLEDFPSSFLNKLRESARLESISDEHKLIVQDLGADDRDLGGSTTAPYHISADDGLIITTSTLEDAAGELLPKGVSLAKRHLQAQGHFGGPGAYVLFCSPRAFESLYSASTLSEFAQIGNANITRTGQLERLYGCDIVISNHLQSTYNADRNLLVTKGVVWGLASQRSMELELQKTIRGQYIDVVWTHRIGNGIVDPTGYIIISSVNT